MSVFHLKFNFLDSLHRTTAFRHLRIDCNGMLSPNAYEEIFSISSKLKHGNVLEVGTASGASAIAAGLGLDFSKIKGKVVTLDKHTGGSRRKFLSVSESLDIVNSNIKNWNLSHIVFPIAIRSGEAIDPEFVGPIDMLILDADGKINRDLNLWKDFCSVNLRVVIDDCENLIRIIEDPIGKWRIDTKKYLTWMLFKNYLEREIFSDCYFVDDCLFANASLEKLNRNIESVSDKIVEDINQYKINMNECNVVFIPDLKNLSSEYNCFLAAGEFRNFFNEVFPHVPYDQYPGLKNLCLDNVITKKGQILDFRLRHSTYFNSKFSRSPILDPRQVEIL